MRVGHSRSVGTSQPHYHSHTTRRTCKTPVSLRLAVSAPPATCWPDVGFAASSSLPSATWVDETLVAAREQTGSSSAGRTADLVPALRRDATAGGGGADRPVFSFYTVDIDEVPEFTYMYELYDPFTIMLFHRHP